MKGAGRQLSKAFMLALPTKVPTIAGRANRAISRRDRFTRYGAGRHGRVTLDSFPCPQDLP
jgi:hypothetical protein